MSIRETLKMLAGAQLVALQDQTCVFAPLWLLVACTVESASGSHLHVASNPRSPFCPLVCDCFVCCSEAWTAMSGALKIDVEAAKAGARASLAAKSQKQGEEKAAQEAKDAEAAEKKADSGLGSVSARVG